MHPCPGNWVAIGRAVVYYARADQAFSAGIKCRHCMYGYFNQDTTTTALIQLAYESMLISKAIFKSIKGSDEN